MVICLAFMFSMRLSCIVRNFPNPRMHLSRSGYLNELPVFFSRKALYRSHCTFFPPIILACPKRTGTDFYEASSIQYCLPFQYSEELRRCPVVQGTPETSAAFILTDVLYGTVFFTQHGKSIRSSCFLCPALQSFK